MTGFSIRLFFLCTSVILLSACLSKDNQSHDKELRSRYSLVKSDHIEIGIDSTASYTSFCMQLLADGDDELLFVENGGINGIQVFSLPDKKQVHSIAIPKEGPGSIRDIHGFTVVSKDSIIVYDNYTLSNSLLINFNGDPLQKFRILHPATAEFFNHASGTPRPGLFKDGKLYFTEFPFGLGLPNPKVYSSGYKREYEFDLATGKTEAKDITWPEVYHGANQWMELDHYFRTLGHNGLMVFSWQASDSILVTNFKDIRKSYYAGSRFFKTGPKPNDSKNTDDPTRFYVETDQYSIIAFDPYREVYYRFVRHGVPFISAAGKVQTADDQPISIIILSKDFEILGESFLEKTGDYLTKDFFVGKKGLYISNHNVNYEKLSEDHMRFTLFVLTTGK